MRFFKVTFVCFCLLFSTLVFADKLPEETLKLIRESASEFCQKPGPSLLLRSLSKDDQVKQAALEEINDEAELHAAVLNFYVLYQMGKEQYAADNKLSEQEVVYHTYFVLRRNQSQKFRQLIDLTLGFIENYPGKSTPSN